MSGGRVIAIVGAESTGKTTLARALAERIAALTGQPTTWVGEWLREWCAREGRTPRADEQAAIAAEQQRRIAAAAAAHAWVVADTTPLMTAVYSELLFDDRSLHGLAAQAHRSYAATLLTAVDLPWEPDGLQRDGPHVRAPVDRLVRQALVDHGLAWSVVGGAGEARVEAALDALTPLLRAHAAPDAGLFTRLARREAAQAAWTWVCRECDMPDCEHAAKRLREAAPR
ncbi:AAA family ATPase [Azohydromonas sediminis]|uniref:AAA family ATPase n=1 Tax=Azohydromonas sediminis TaxID=2259674 RepID=UPI000E65D7CF|nr:ATP-binding protein [Azohydromonas sediminis]